MDRAQIGSLIRDLKTAGHETQEILTGGQATTAMLLKNQLVILRALVAVLEDLRK